MSEPEIYSLSSVSPVEIPILECMDRLDESRGIDSYVNRASKIAGEAGRLAALDPDAAHSMALDLIYFDPQHLPEGINALVEVGNSTGDFRYIEEALAIARARTEKSQLGVKLATIVRRGFVIDPERMIDEARAIEIPNARAKLLAQIAFDQESLDLLMEANDFTEENGLRAFGLNYEISIAGKKLDYGISIDAHMRTKPKRLPEEKKQAERNEYILECVGHGFSREDTDRLLNEIGGADIAEAFLWASLQDELPRQFVSFLSLSPLVEQALKMADDIYLDPQASAKLLEAAKNLIDKKLEEIKQFQSDFETLNPDEDIGLFRFS